APASPTRPEPSSASPPPATRSGAPTAPTWRSPTAQARSRRPDERAVLPLRSHLGRHHDPPHLGAVHPLRPARPQLGRRRLLLALPRPDGVLYRLEAAALPLPGVVGPAKRHRGPGLRRRDRRGKPRHPRGGGVGRLRR